jgi:hypothetical protein
VIVRSFAACLLALAASYASAQSASPAPPARLGLKLPPSALGRSITLQQQLHVEREDGSHDLQMVIDVDEDHVELVGLAFGQRVLTAYYDGKTLKEKRHMLLPSQVRSEDILEDIQLTYWPTQAIRDALPAGWTIEDEDKRRTLLLDDKPVMVIEYSSNPRWNGKVELSNLRYGYHLTIQSVVANQ